MTMKMKTSQVISANRVFGNKQYANQRVTMKVSLWFARNGKVTSEVVKAFRQASSEIFDEFAVEAETDDGKKIREVPDDAMIAYQEKIEELMNEEVQIEVFKMAEEDFGDFKLTPKDTFGVLYAIDIKE